MHAQLDAVLDIVLNALFNRGATAAGDAEMLDSVAEFRGVGEVFRRQRADAFGVDVGEAQRNAEGDRRHDGELVGGVDAIDIEARVGFGVAERLGLGEHVLEPPPARRHFAENEVAGAIDDSGEPFDAVGGEPLAQGFDDGDAAGDAAFVGEHRATAGGGREQLVAALGDQRLVGGYHMLAVGKRLGDQPEGGVEAAHGLHHDLHFRVRGHGEWVPVKPDRGVDFSSFRAPGRDMDDPQRRAGAAGDFSGVVPQQPQAAATHGAETTDSNLEGCLHRERLIRRCRAWPPCGGLRGSRGSGGRRGK